jgi:hypothetical protein
LSGRARIEERSMMRRRAVLGGLGALLLAGASRPALFGDGPAGSIAAAARALMRRAPTLERIALLVDPGNRGTAAILRAIDAIAPALGCRWTAFPVHDAPSIAAAVAAAARAPNTGLLLPADATIAAHAAAIQARATRYRLPSMQADAV